MINFVCFFLLLLFIKISFLLNLFFFIYYSNVCVIYRKVCSFFFFFKLYVSGYNILLHNTFYYMILMIFPRSLRVTRHTLGSRPTRPICRVLSIRQIMTKYSAIPNSFKNLLSFSFKNRERQNKFIPK